MTSYSNPFPKVITEFGEALVIGKYKTDDPEYANMDLLFLCFARNFSSHEYIQSLGTGNCIHIAMSSEDVKLIE